MPIKYYIGEEYRYPNSTKVFRLVESTGQAFRFACGHWCTDNVFRSLIRCKTGVQVYEDVQLELFTLNYKL